MLRMKRGKSFIVLTFVLLLAMLLGACGGASTPAVQEAGEETGETTAVEEVPTEEPTQEEAPAEEAAGEEAAAQGEFTVGVMQLVTHPALDAAREGTLQALEDAGFVHGENLTVLQQNAEGDIPTLTTIAQSFVDEGVDLIVAITTPGAQAAFSVVKDLESPPVVYNSVTDPFAAGLATAPDDHPDWIVGTQALPPVEVAMQTMLEIVPDIETVGMIYNPSEKNSQVTSAMAGDVADELGIELLEATVTDSSEVQTAAESLIAQGVDAFFISTDSTVVAGFEALAKVANENQVPLFANDPASAGRGAVAAVGLDYFEDGYDSGTIAAQILSGEATPADFTIEPQEATSLAVNTEAAEAQGVTLPDEILERAAMVYGDEGEAEVGEEETEAAPEGEFTVGMMQLVTHPALDAGQEGALQALEDAGFVEGENLTVLQQNAEGDIATLTTIAQSFVDEGVDLIIATSTPAAQAAFNVVKDLENPPVVYNVVTDPFAAGLATAPDDHPDWIVGTQALPPVEVAMETVLEIMREAERLGIIWNPAEKNSEVATSIARDVAEQLGLELVEANVADSSEIQTAAESLIAQDIDAFFISTDSTVVAGFEALAKVANENQVPLFANDPASASRGAAAAVGVDYFQDGYDSGTIAAQILSGEATPADFTIEPQAATILAINNEAAEAQGVSFPDEIVERAATIYPEE